MRIRKRPPAIVEIPDHGTLQPLVGRKSTHENLRGRLNSVRSVCLYGPQGVGKSALALDYARRAVAQSYDAIFWIDATNSSTIEQGLLYLSKVVLIDSGAHTSANDRILAMLDWLSKHRSLLVLDNVADQRTFPLRLVSANRDGHTIVTSRTPCDEVDAGIRVNVLRREAAVDLLIRTSNRHSVGTHERAAANRMAIEVSCNPQLLVQIGISVRNADVPFSVFLSKWKSSASPTKRELSLAVYGETLHGVARQSSSAMELARLLALSGVELPKELMIRIAKHCSQSLSRSASEPALFPLGDELAILARDGLIRQDHNRQTVIMHSLVVDAVLAHAEKRVLTRDRRRFLAGIAAAYDDSTQYQREHYLGPARAAIDLAVSSREFAMVAALCERTLRFAYGEARRSGSRPAAEYVGDGVLREVGLVVDSLSKASGKNHSVVSADTYSFCGNVLRLQDKHEVALVAYGHALRVPGASLLSRAGALVGRGNVLKTMSRIAEAEECFNAAIESIDAAAFDESQSREAIEIRAAALFGLGNVVFAQSRWGDAASAYRRAQSYAESAHERQKTSRSLELLVGAIKGQADVHVKTGDVQSLRSSVNLARQVFLRAPLAARDKLVDAKISQAEGDALRIAYRCGDWAAAGPCIKAYSEAERLYHELDAPLGVGISLMKRGEILALSNDMVSARENFLVARQTLLEVQQNRLHLAKSELMLLRCAVIDGEFNRPLVQKLLALSRTFAGCGSHYLQAEAWIAASVLLSRLGREACANIVRNRALATYRRLNKFEKEKYWSGASNPATPDALFWE